MLAIGNLSVVVELTVYIRYTVASLYMAQPEKTGQYERELKSRRRKPLAVAYKSIESSKTLRQVWKQSQRSI
jgi:hypothetical protein